MIDKEGMDDMGGEVKKFSPAIFGVALICFFLPFISASCSGQKLVTLTGIQLVTGMTVERPESLWGQRQTERVNGEPLAIIAFISVLCGLGLSFIKGRKGLIMPTIMGAVGAVCLLALKSKVDSEILRQGEGMIQVEYGAGFWLAFLSLICAVGVNIFLVSQSKERVIETYDDTSNAVVPNEIGCPNCGAAIKVDAKFCRECGAPLSPNESDEQAQVDAGEEPVVVCPKCGAEPSQDAGFCKKCGTQLIG